METVIKVSIIALALLGFVAWLGGGRKWAFRTLLSLLALAAIGVAGTLLYWYWTEKSAEHRAQKIHECAIAKLADPKCEEPPNNSTEPRGWQVVQVCPPYTLSDNASPQQEEEALSLAEQECRGEMNPNEKSLHEQLVQYKHDHNIGESTPKLNAKDCAARVRSFYPHAYDDMDDATLTKKVLAKYPDYCDTKVSSGFVPDIQTIR